MKKQLITYTENLIKLLKTDNIKKSKNLNVNTGILTQFILFIIFLLKC